MANGGKCFVPSAGEWFALFRARNGMEYRAISIVGWVHEFNAKNNRILVEGYISPPPATPDCDLIPARDMENRQWEMYDHEIVGYRTLEELSTLGAAQNLPVNIGWIGEDMNEALWPEAVPHVGQEMP